MTAAAAIAPTEPSRSQNVQQRCSHVQVARIAVAQHCEGDHVHHEARHRDREHRPPEDGSGRAQAADRLDDDPRRDREQKPVHKRGENLEAVITVAALLVVRPARDPDGDPCERERRGVGEHVAGVGDERERAGSIRAMTRIGPLQLGHCSGSGS
jgi:hypothetical protein